MLECRAEIWHQKTRIVGLPEGEEIVMLAFFILTQYRRVTDRQTDRHVPITKTPASIASRGQKCKHEETSLTTAHVCLCSNKLTVDCVDVDVTVDDTTTLAVSLAFVAFISIDDDEISWTTEPSFKGAEDDIVPPAAEQSDSTRPKNRQFI